MEICDECGEGIGVWDKRIDGDRVFHISKECGLEDIE